MGTVHIWVENDKIARDLFVTRQKKYCDRNVLPAAVKVKYGSELLPLMGYGDAFRRYKNFMHMIMRQSNPKQFYGWPVVENKKTLRRLIETPEQWSEHMIVHCKYHRANLHSWTQLTFDQAPERLPVSPGVTPPTAPNCSPWYHICSRPSLLPAQSSTN